MHRSLTGCGQVPTRTPRQGALPGHSGQVIIDSHCHAWRRWPYDATVPDLDTRGSVEALLHEMDQHGVQRAVVVCARIGRGRAANPDNNDYVAAAVARHPDRLIGFADVDSCWSREHHTPGAASRLREAAERWSLMGFTHYLDECDGWLNSDEGRQFVAVAAELDLVASLSMSPRWQPSLRQVAREHPTLPILVHHQGMASTGSADFASELAEVLTTAALPSVLVKVSGFHYLSDPGWAFPYDHVRERVFQALCTAYGPERLAWGSDFPAARVHLTYRQSLEVVRAHSPWLSAQGMARVLGGTMAEILRTRRPPVMTSA